MGFYAVFRRKVRISLTPNQNNPPGSCWRSTAGHRWTFWRKTTTMRAACLSVISFTPLIANLPCLGHNKRLSSPLAHAGFISSRRRSASRFPNSVISKSVFSICLSSTLRLRCQSTRTPTPMCRSIWKARSHRSHPKTFRIATPAKAPTTCLRMSRHHCWAVRSPSPFKTAGLALALGKASTFASTATTAAVGAL